MLTNGALLMAATSVLLATNVAPATGATATQKSQLQQGLAFYRGKTVTMIVDGVIGGPYDGWARALAPYLSAYLHATVNVVNPAGNVPTQQMEDEIAGEQNNGLGIGVTQLFVPISDDLLGQTTINFNMARETWIAAENPPAEVLIAAPGSAYTTVAAMKAATVPMRVIDGPQTATTNALMRGLFGILGLKAQYITGYVTAALQATGFVRGDAPVTMLALSTGGPLIAAGKAVAVATTDQPPPGALYGNLIASVPTYAQIFKEYPPKGRTNVAAAQALLDVATGAWALLSMPTNITPYKVVAMRAAAAWAYSKKGFQAQLVQDGLDTGFISAVAAKAEFITSLKEDKSLARYMSYSSST